MAYRRQHLSQPTTIEQFFEQAVDRGDVEKVLSMWQQHKGGSLRASNLHEGLRYAANKGHYDACVVLLEMGADPNKPNETGFRALHHVTRDNNLPLQKLLLDAGADWGVTTNSSHAEELLTPVQLAFSLQQDNAERYDNQQAIKQIDRYASMPAIDFSKPFAKRDLFKSDPDTGYTPLDNPNTWHEWDRLTQTLQAQGETLTLDDLKGENCEGIMWLQRGVECRQFSKINPYLQAQGDYIGAAELLQGGEGNTLLETMEKQRCISELFTVAHMGKRPRGEATLIHDAMGEYGQAQVYDLRALNTRLARVVREPKEITLH